MNNVLRRGVLVATIVLLAPVVAMAGAAVENFSGSGTVSVQYPGTETANGTSFNAEAVLTSLSFAPGKQVVGTDEIELHGLEAAADHLVVAGQVLVPRLWGQGGATLRGEAAIVNTSTNEKVITGTMTLKGVPVKSVSVDELSLGKTITPVGAAMTNLAPNGGCAASQLEYMAASGIGSRNYSTFVRDFESNSSVSIVNVDAANGLVDFSGLGDISQVDKVTGATSASTFIPMAGLGLLLFGLGGLALAKVMPQPRLALAE